MMKSHPFYMSLDVDLTPVDFQALQQINDGARVSAILRTRLHRATLAGVFPDAQTCAVGGPDDVIVLTGSIYLLGEVLARIEPALGAGEGRLQDF